MSDKKRICLGMPGYGHLTSGAARGFWRASDGRHDLSISYYEASLLAQNFNGLWCWALNQQRAGKRVDYFAMLHADIEPQDGWLDVLIEELETHNLDVISAVVPIKNEQGMTSTALDRTDGYTWNPRARLTMQEVFKLPETFTEADTGLKLLLNTGCWVCKFDPTWNTKVHFTINDRIIFDEKRDAFVAQVEPEDWNMSRQWNALGLKLGATRKVQLHHAGQLRYPNNEPWGTCEYDPAFTDRSLLAEPDAAAKRDGILLEMK